MASSKERVAYVIERLNIATDGNVSSRAMMGEYVVYYRDKVIGEEGYIGKNLLS